MILMQIFKKGSFVFWLIIIQSLSLHAQENQDLDAYTLIERMDLEQLHAALDFESNLDLDGGNNSDYLSSLNFEIAQRHFANFMDSGNEETLLLVMDFAESALDYEISDTSKRIDQLLFIGEIYYELRYFDVYDLRAFQKFSEVVNLDPDDRYTSLIYMDLAELLGVPNFAFEHMNYLLVNDTEWFLEELGEKFIIIASASGKIDQSIEALGWIEFQSVLSGEPLPDRFPLLSAGLHLMNDDRVSAQSEMDRYTGSADDDFYRALQERL